MGERSPNLVTPAAPGGEGSPRPNVHPLLSVWFQPGPTIMQIHATNPGRLYFPLAAIWGASYSLGVLLNNGIPAETLDDPRFGSPWVILGINGLFGAVFGIIVLWALSFLFAWLSRVLGGQGGARDVRTVLAWSSVPHIPNLVVTVLVILLGGTAVLSAPQPFGPSVFAHPLRLLSTLARAVIFTWSFVIGVAGLGPLMRIGTPRAVAVLVLGGLTAFAVLVSLIMTIARLVGG